MTIVCTTCPDCGVRGDVPAERTVLELPDPTADPEAAPHLVHACPVCSAVRVTAVSWRLAAYLHHYGATTLLAPDEEQARPLYPERRPATTTPMTLDDLIALHAALDAPVASL